MSENFRRRPPTYERTSIGDSVDIATMKLLKATYDTNVDKNIVSSPLGLMMLLSLYNEGAGPQAKSEITKFLGGIDSKQAAEKTKGHITNPVSKDALTSDTAAALFNVIFFNGHWHVPFEAKDTKEKDFHVCSGNVVQKPMMHLFQSLFYTPCEGLGARMIELPYKEQGFRMVVVLPNEMDGLPSVLEKVAEKGLLSDVFKLSPAGRVVDLDMPKFDIRTNLDFNDILPKVGVSSMFSEPATGIVENVPVKVSKTFQEAFIKVNEEGATAGAFTGAVWVFLSASSRPPTPMKFTVDHPFMYAILYEDKILFAGTYSG